MSLKGNYFRAECCGLVFAKQILSDEYLLMMPTLFCPRCGNVVCVEILDDIPECEKTQALAKSLMDSFGL